MANVYRAPIHQEERVIGGEEDKRPRTRVGYLVPEAYSCYETALGETGAAASGKALHFAADLVCSGGLDIWIRGAYSYAMQHIGLANPRIFVYLRQRISELDKQQEQLSNEAFYSNPNVQAGIAEVVLVIQLCPKRTKIAWPKVDPSTKRLGWLRGVASAPETMATRAVWSSDGDTAPLYLVANEICKAIAESAIEKALFWIRWILEEDARVRKETKGHGLSTKERGTESSSKTRSEAGHFVAALLLEIYRDLATKNLVRMTEEFNELIRLWKGGEQRMAARFKKESLALMTLICCEVPKWRVPAAPSLVADPLRLSRAVGQSTSFFNEVLAHRSVVTPLKPNMMKAPRQKRKLNEKDKKEMTMDEHFDAYDAAMEAYLNK
jgi:hypothetical protein